MAYYYTVTVRESDGHESSYEFESQNEAVGFLVRNIVIYSGNIFTFETKVKK